VSESRIALMASASLPTISFATAEQWRVWLNERHASAPGVWLKIAKQGLGIQTVTYAQALDVALCFGWIDGQKNRFDERYWLQRFTPRKPRSKWSQINVAKATELIASGAMQPAGLAEVQRAQADGRWERAYTGQRTATVPEDLRRALDQNPAASEFFATLNSVNRYAILYRIQDAKLPDTRARRIEKYVAMLNDGKQIHS
jgi:uncharacterized protein YdeI (YjbR/CyaY-like superfamily)